MRSTGKLLVLGLVSAAFVACSTSAVPEVGLDAELALEEEFLLLGSVTRADMEAMMPDWVMATVEAEVETEAALDLADVVTSAEVTVFFGSWCSDSRRELGRLWKALDLAGGDVGFPIRYIGVDRSKSEPAESVGGREILYVPTFVVERDGRELGQIIEHSPHGIEVDLRMLLTGESSGWISARDDLAIVQPGGDH